MVDSYLFAPTHNHPLDLPDYNNAQTIPYFFVEPNQNVAEVLNQLAVSTQSAIFFDEYNNLVVMSKNYMMAKESERSTDFIISGNSDITVRSNPTTSIETGKSKLFVSTRVAVTTVGTSCLISSANAKVDTNKEKELSEIMKFDGVPTLFLFHNGNYSEIPYPYENPHELTGYHKDDIICYINKKVH